MSTCERHGPKQSEKTRKASGRIYIHKTGVCLSAFRLKYFLNINMNLYMLAHAEYKYSIKTHMINFFFFLSFTECGSECSALFTGSEQDHIGSGAVVLWHDAREPVRVGSSLCFQIFISPLKETCFSFLCF